MIPQKDKDRFLKKIRILSNDECWIWIGAKFTRRPSGILHPTFVLNRKVIKANRVAWMVFKGDIPEGKQVLHTCDNKRCVNPNHLYLGTHADNMGDLISRHYFEIYKPENKRSA
jgi:hypothetical protein